MWNLYIDDIRFPPRDRDWLVCRSSQEALDRVTAMGMPQFISFDHDLGEDDTTMVFLRRLVNEVWDGVSLPPDYQIHSANPVGAENIRSFMDSWRRSMSL
ncbi:MAG: hypothetical protein EB023_12990 [Flavobacteriia bacterium]|nr:hypothetical protein [Flavobacteriia bacterium]